MPVIIVGQVTVPDVTGLPLSAARAALGAVYLTDVSTGLRSFAGSNGTIASQSPVGGTDVDAQTTVALTVYTTGSSNTRVIRDIDATMPNAPTGLAGNGTAETDIFLSWNAATDPQGAFAEKNSGVVSYRVYQDGVFKVGLPNTSVQLAGLTAYTFYAIQVSSVDAAGNESYLSAPVSVRTLDTTAPTVPTVVASQGGSAQISVALTVQSTDSLSGL